MPDSSKSSFSLISSNSLPQATWSPHRFLEWSPLPMFLHLISTDQPHCLGSQFSAQHQRTLPKGPAQVPPAPASMISLFPDSQHFSLIWQWILHGFVKTLFCLYCCGTHLAFYFSTLYFQSYLHENLGPGLFYFFHSCGLKHCFLSKSYVFNKSLVYLLKR